MRCAGACAVVFFVVAFPVPVFMGAAFLVPVFMPAAILVPVSLAAAILMAVALAAVQRSWNSSPARSSRAVASTSASAPSIVSSDT